jgi:putative SOS response-associated peptidase YedK
VPASISRLRVRSYEAVHTPARAIFLPTRLHAGVATHVARSDLIKLKDQELFALAGLYEEWTNSEGEPIKTYAILTCGPNKLMAPIHNRMPVILTPKAEGLWLNPAAELPALRQLLKPYAASAMEAFPVSRDVNSPANEGPELIQAADA